MFLIDWYRQYLELKSEMELRRRETNFCQSCNNLKMEVASLRDENKYLLSHLLNKPVVEDKEPELEVLKPILPRPALWSSTRRRLETESQAEANRLAEEKSKEIAAKAVLPTQKVAVTVEEIEKQIGVMTDAK